MTTYTIVDKIAGIESRIRQLDVRIEREELRNKQIIIMFKMILEKVYGVRRAKVRIKDVVSYMDLLVSKNIEPESIRETDDLLSDLIKKGKSD